VERYQGRPFALIGVNMDQDPDLVRQLQQEGTVTWRSFSVGADEIADAYGVRGIPKVVVIDHKGVVQFISGLPSETELDGKLDQLVKEAEVGR
jgi:thioredoxin-like negative regulator of GroEL